jgi:aminoglycoside phosphotransferase (APT) family kinase protein
MSEVIASIQSAYELDRQRGPARALSADELPLTYEGITAQWLTDILCGNCPGARVQSFELGPTDNGSSNRRRIRIEYNPAGRAAGLPTHLFCKASHDLRNRMVLGVSGGAYTEVTFYNRMRPLLNIEAPRACFAHFDENTYNSIIMLRDLTGQVREFGNHETVMSLERAQSQLALLAELHGSGYGNPQLRVELQRIATWPDYFNKTLAFGMETGSNAGFLAAESVIPPRLYRRYEEIWPATLATVQRHNQLPQTLAHGDVHLKNWYVAGDGRMGLGDWQCASRGHWGRDVAYAIATALTPENRRAWERDLLRFYLERMQAAGGPRTSFDAGWTRYREQLISALTWWTVTLKPPEAIPDMQPEETTYEFIRRIAIAMDDVDSLGSLDGA